jgi:glucan phosphorylase
MFGDPQNWAPIVDSISNGNDYYLVTVDFPLYCTAQAEVDEVFRDRCRWAKMMIFSIARSWVFSSDRTVLQYAVLLKTVCFLFFPPLGMRAISGRSMLPRFQGRCSRAKF